MPQLDPPASACSLEDLASGAVRGDVLANTTSVGMHPQASRVGHAKAESQELRWQCMVPPNTALTCVLLAAFATSHEQLLRSANPQEDETPVPAAALPGFQLVFDAVYTPLHTRLLKCAARGAAWVGGRG